MRPKTCPGCGQSHIVGHGWYPRRAAYLDQNQPIKVKRWRCPGCKKTISQLPDFLHRHRHYALSVIESVLQARIEEGQTWDQVKLTASTRTVRRWVAAFLARAPVWFLLLLSTLAQTRPELEIFDPHGASSMRDQARALLALSRVFAHWLDPGHAGAGNWGALRRVWRWGWNAGIGRLV